MSPPGLLTVTLDAAQLARARAALANAGSRIEHARPLWAEIGRILRDHTTLRFEAERGPDGRPWAPVALGTARRKQAKRKTSILTFDGYLRGSLTYAAADDHVRWGAGGAASDYAAVHQLGTIDMPARPYLGIDDDDAEDIEAAVIDWLEGAFA
jgi:phage virion morphogenesis protein